MSDYAYKPNSDKENLAVHKQRSIDKLTDYFSRDVLSSDDYEIYVEKVEKAFTVAEIDAILANLPKVKSSFTLGENQSTNNSTAYNQNNTSGYDQNNADRPYAQMTEMPVFSILSGRKISGSKLASGQTQVFCLMGGVDIDFRNVNLKPGENRVEVFCLMGGVDIIVPPDLAVHNNAIAIMGGSDIRRDVKQEAYPGEPYIVIEGVILMGGVEVKVRK